MIYRNQNETNFTIISNDLANDSSISFEARGVLVYLLSKPKDWQVRHSNIVNASGAGKDKVSKIINELIAAGYLIRVQGRNEDGSFDTQSIDVYGEPQMQYTGEDSPQPDFPEPVKPEPVKPPLQSNKKKQRNDVDKDASEIGNNSDSDFLESFPEMEPEHFNKIKKTKQLVNSWKGLTGCSLPSDEDKRKEDYTGPAIALLKRTDWNVSEAFDMLQAKRRQMLANDKTPFRLAAVVPYIFADGDAVGATHTGKEWWE